MLIKQSIVCKIKQELKHLLKNHYLCTKRKALKILLSTFSLVSFALTTQNTQPNHVYLHKTDSVSKILYVFWSSQNILFSRVKVALKIIYTLCRCKLKL